MKIIYTCWLATELQNRGCKLIKIEQNHNSGMERMNVWFFQNDLKLKTEMDSILGERHKK